MGCRKLIYDHFSPTLKVAYSNYGRKKTQCTSKYQWDVIHDPQSTLFAWAQDEEEGAAIDLDIIISDAQEQGIGFDGTGTITCITPAGKPYTLPSNIKTLDFTSNTDDFPDGALVGFRTKENETYVAVFKRKSKNFLGYAQVINPDAEKAKDRIGYKDEAKKIPDCRVDDVTKTLTEESRVLLGKKSDCAIDLYQIIYSEVSDKTGISEEGYCGTGTFNNQPLAYNLDGKEPVVVGDNTACLNKYAKEFYEGHLEANHEEHKETLLRIANLLSSIEGGGDALFKDYEKYCNKAGSRRYYGNPDLWGTPDDYKLFEKALEAYINNQKNLEKIILEEKDRDKLTDLAWLLVEKYSKNIDYEVRIHIIKKLSEDAMYGNRFFGKGQEYLANRIIYGINDTKEQAAFLTELTQNDLLKTLFNRMGDEGGGDNFSTFIMLLSHMAKNNTATFGIQGDPLFIWVGDLFRSDKVKIDFATEGKVTLQGFKKEFTCYPSYYGAGTGCVSSWAETSDKYTLSPFTFVPVKFPKGEKYLKTLSDDGSDITFVPLVYLMALNTKRNVDVGKTTAGIVIDVGSLCIGVGELNMAIKAIKNGTTAIKMLRLAAMTADVVITSSDILITLVEDDLQELDGGQEFLEKYKVYSALSGLLLFGADNLTNSPEVLSGLSDSWRKFKNAHADDPKKVINAVGGPERYKTVEGLVDKTEEALKQTEHTTLVSKTPDFDNNYAKAISGIAEDWKKNALGLEIEKLTVAPLGYQFYRRDGNKWIRRLDADDPNTPQLTVNNGLIVVVNKYADNLSGVIKVSCDELISAGVRHLDDGTSIKFFSTNGDEIIEITDGSFNVKKWQAHYNGTVEKELKNGYWLIKDGDEYSIDLGFAERKALDAEEVNDYLIHGQGKDADGQPYLNGTRIDEVVLGNNAEVIYFVEDFNNGMPNPGQYASKDPISTIKELRERLAVKEAWKKTSDIPTLRAYKVKSSLRCRSGLIGPQIENGVTLPGGGHQYEIIDYLRGENWKSYLEEIGPKGGIKLNL